MIIYLFIHFFLPTLYQIQEHQGIHIYHCMLAFWAILCQSVIVVCFMDVYRIC